MAAIMGYEIACRFFLALSALLWVTVASSDPACDSTVDPTPGTYYCDYPNLGKPAICIATFDTPPQFLTLTAVSGVLSAELFSEFGYFNGTEPPILGEPVTLTLDCEYGDIYLEEDSFLGLDWLQRLVFINCHFPVLPRNALKTLGTLDSLEFYGGSIDSFYGNSLHGFTIARDSTLNEAKGQIYMENMAFGGQRLPPNMFKAHVDTISSISIINADLVLLDPETFNDLSLLAELDLSRNDFRYLPAGMFNGTTSIWSLTLDQIPFDCSTCEVTWFLDWAASSRVTVFGDLHCVKPTDLYNTRLSTLHEQSCQEEAEDERDSGDLGEGVWLLGTFIPMREFVNWILTLLCLIVGLAGLIAGCRARRQQVPPGAASARNLTMINLSLTQQEQDWLHQSDGMGSKYETTSPPSTAVSQKRPPVEIVHMPPDKPVKPKKNKVSP